MLLGGALEILLSPPRWLYLLQCPPLLSILLKGIKYGPHREVAGLKLQENLKFRERIFDPPGPQNHTSCLMYLSFVSQPLLWETVDLIISQ